MTRFLLIGVPYHSEYLDGVTDTVEEELEDEELWDAKDLKIPVYNTVDGISHSLFNLGTYRLNFISIGSDMRELKSSVTRSLSVLYSPPHCPARLRRSPVTVQWSPLSPVKVWWTPVEVR